MKEPPIPGSRVKDRDGDIWVRTDEDLWRMVQFADGSSTWTNAVSWRVLSRTYGPIAPV